MCGIGGIIKLEGSFVDENELVIIHQSMQERGPDAAGFHVDRQVGFCHRRLSIIDLNEASNQPFQILDGKIWITFNGEIYNYLSLRKELIALGATFRTTSDTEVICWAYKIWGIEITAKRINGMYAFALYDQTQQEVYLVRDKFGKKPFYLYQNGLELVFASDIKAIWNIRKKELHIDEDALHYYLCEISSPQPKTIWKEIREIRPAHILTINIPSGKISEQEYWRLKPYENRQISLEETIQQVEKTLKEAILSRTIADVPLGCFLSGGVDSGLVVSMLAANSTQRIKTFSVGLSYQAFNELPEARLVADKFNTDHHEIILESDVVQILPELVEYFGEPFADSSMIPTYYCSKALKSHVTVALSGDGGDEMFGGYEDYAIAARAEMFQNKYPNAALRKLVTNIDKLAYRFSQRKENLGSLAHYLSKPGYLKLYREIGYHPDLIKQLFIGETANYTKQYLNEIWHIHQTDSLTHQVMWSSLETRLLNDYLVKVDRASMKNSLEVRSPFLDAHLAELAFSIPISYKFKGQHSKYILKKLAEKYFNPDIFRQTKRGFGIPVHHWLRTDLKKYSEEILFSGTLEKLGWFNMSQIRQIWKEHLNNKPGVDHTHTIWALLCLAIWLEKFYSQ